MTLALAAGYILFLTIAYYSFIRVYRNSKRLDRANAIAPTDWFEDGHPARKEYITVYNDMPDELGPAEIRKLKPLLIQRCKTNVKRILALREDRATLSLLLRNGTIGDDLWNEFCVTETSTNFELSECMREAEDLERGWGKTIMQEAAQLVGEDAHREAEEQRKAAVIEQKRKLIVPTTPGQPLVSESGVIQTQIKPRRRPNKTKRR